jgi:hypothetical protein
MNCGDTRYDCSVNINKLLIQQSLQFIRERQLLTATICNHDTFNDKERRLRSVIMGRLQTDTGLAIALVIRHCISPLSIWFSAGWLHARFVVTVKWNLNTSSQGLLCLPLVFTILPLLHTHLSPLSEACDTRKQAAHYHILGLSNCHRAKELAFAVKYNTEAPTVPRDRQQDFFFSVKRFVSLQFLNLRQLVVLLERGISPSQCRYLTQTDLHALSGSRTHDPSVRAGEYRSCLRPRGHCDRR